MHQGDADALRHLVMHNNPKPILKGYCSLVNHIPNLQFTPKTYKRKCRLGDNCYPMIHKYYLFIFNNFMSFLCSQHGQLFKMQGFKAHVSHSPLTLSTELKESCVDGCTE